MADTFFYDMPYIFLQSPLVLAQAKSAPCFEQGVNATKSEIHRCGVKMFTFDGN